MDNEDLDPSHWDDQKYLQYLDEREELTKKVNSIHRNVLDTTSDRHRLYILVRSIEIYRKHLNTTEAQYS